MLNKGKALLISFITVRQSRNKREKSIVREGSLEVVQNLVLDFDGGLPSTPRAGTWSHSSRLSLALSIVQGTESTLVEQ